MSLERGSAMPGIDDQSEQQTGNEPGRDPGFFERQRNRAFRRREKGEVYAWVSDSKAQGFVLTCVGHADGDGRLDAGEPSTAERGERLDDWSLAPQANLQNDHIVLTSCTASRSSSNRIGTSQPVHRGDEFKENIYV
jgi:hypothetical protein